MPGCMTSFLGVPSKEGFLCWAGLEIEDLSAASRIRMYSWQQFTEDAAIVLGGGTEGRKKASEILQNQKFLAVAGGTFLGVVLLYSIRKLYQRTKPKPGLRKSRISAHELCQTSGPEVSVINLAVNNLEILSDRVTENNAKENLIEKESSNTVPDKVSDTETALVNGLPDQNTEEVEPSLKTEENMSEVSSNQTSPKHGEKSLDQEKLVENGHHPSEDMTKKRNTILNDKLQSYYNSYVKIPEEHLSIVRTIVEDFKYMFEHCCEELLPNHKLQGLHTAGSSGIGLQVVQPDGVDILVSLALDPALWVLVDAGQSVMSAHGYWLIKRQQMEFFSHGSSKYDKYLIADYLSPNKILSAFLDMINRVAKWSDEYKVQAEVVGPSVTLKVFYQDNKCEQRTVMLDFIPSVSLENVTLVAKAHHMAEDDASFANLWRQSFEEEENKRIFSERPDGNVAPKCLQIIKAIRRSFPFHLGLLNSYVYKTAVLLVLKQEEDWAEDALAERFVDVLKILENCLSTQSMGHWVCSQQNLLTHFNADLLQFMGQSIKDVLQSGHFDGLLQVPQ